MTAVTTTATMTETPMDANQIIENINATVSARYTLAVPEPSPLEPSQICAACKGIFTFDNVYNDADAAFPDIRRTGEIIHQSLGNVAKAVMSGCHLCTTVYTNIDPEALRTFRRRIDTSFSNAGLDNMASSWGFASIHPIARDQARLSFRWVPSPELIPFGDQAKMMPNHRFTMHQNNSRGTVNSDNSLSSRNFGIEVTADLILMNPAYAVEPGVRVIASNSVSTSSQDCFDIAREWIDDCSFNHMKCSATEGSEAIEKPTYLLDVTIRGPGGAPGVRLIDGQFLDPFTQYVTLSHCWGMSSDPSVKRIRLHKKTLAALRQGVASASLPKTFAEAAAATRKLGFRYIWIDALCIMHDNEKAVLDEIANMHRVYSEATVNLSATSSRDDHAGLFYERNPKSVQPAVVAVGDGFGIASGPYKVLRSTTWDDLVDTSPIARRAWVLQERALSKRTLHFTRNELLWECQQMCCSETFPKGLPVTIKAMSERDKRANGIGRASSPTPTTSSSRSDNVYKAPVTIIPFNKREHHQRTSAWPAIVEQYSPLRQSYTSDKLLGISGLARQYMSRNRLRPQDYAAGLWKTNLPQSLLWRSPDANGRRPSKYRAPSWSWASLDGRVVFPLQQATTSKQACLEVLDVSVQCKNEDPLGMCESGSIKVRGFIGKGRIRRTRDYWGACSFILHSSARGPGAGDVRFDNAWFDERLTKLSNEDGTGMVETMEIYLLPVIDAMDRVEGLILSATLKKGDFRRLGTFEISNGGGTGAMPTGMMNAQAREGEDQTRSSSRSRDPVQMNWDRFKGVMKGDPEMTNYDERLSHENAYWFASDYTYTFNLL